MKLGFDAKRLLYNHSGLGNYSRNMLTYLQEYFPEEEYYLFAVDRPGKITFTPAANTHFVHPPGNTGGFRAAYWRSKGILRERHFKNLDIFHGLSAELPAGISETKVKAVLTVHDVIYLRYPHLYRFIDRKIYHWKTKKACEEADKIIAISRQTKEDIIRFYKVDENKIEIVYQGCSPLFARKWTVEQLQNIKKKYNLPDEYLLMVGTIEERKNALLAVKAIHRHHIPVPLVLVGKETKYSREIRSYIAKNGLEKQVHFIHNVAFEDLPGIYQNAKIFLYLSVFEGFGIPLLEAFHSGVPVIASDIDVFGEVAGDAALFACKNDVEDTAQQILRLLENEDERAKLIKRGNERKKRFSPQRIAQDLMSVYQNVLHK